jgi:hypothetical protein
MLFDLYEIQEICDAKPWLSTLLVWGVPKKLLNPPSVCVLWGTFLRGLTNGKKHPEWGQHNPIGGT